MEYELTAFELHSAEVDARARVRFVALERFARSDYAESAMPFLHLGVYSGP